MMELREYLKILKNNLGLIIIITLLVTAGTLIFSLKQKVSYEADSNITVIPKSNAELNNDYEYDGYYALQSASTFSNTISLWLQSPGVVIEIYNKAGSELDKNTSSKILSKQIKTTVLPNASSLKFQIQNENKEKVQKLASAINETVKAKTTEFNQKFSSGISFEVITSEPLLIEIKPKTELNTLAGVLAGLVLGIFLAFLREYFRK